MQLKGTCTSTLELHALFRPEGCEDERGAVLISGRVGGGCLCDDGGVVWCCVVYVHLHAG